MTLAQRYHQDGRQEGRHEAHQEGILDALAVRFECVPEGLKEAVLQIQDDAKLRDLHRAAIRCGTLEEFAAEL